jgi:hypothetical protein
MDKEERISVEEYDTAIKTMPHVSREEIGKLLKKHGNSNKIKFCLGEFFALIFALFFVCGPQLQTTRKMKKKTKGKRKRSTGW